MQRTVRFLKQFVTFMLFMQCIFLQLVHQPRNTQNKIQSMTNINLLHVTTSTYHPQSLTPVPKHARD